MATHGSFDFAFSMEKTNYARLCQAISEPGAEVLRIILNGHIPPADIFRKVKSRNLRLNLLQRRTIYGSNRHNYSQFDVTLLYLLIRSLCPAIAPTHRWADDMLPTALEVTEGDDVKRINYIKNSVYGHVYNASIDNAAYSQYWSILEGVISRTDIRYGTQLIQDLKKIEKSYLTSSNVEKLQRKLESDMQHLKRQTLKALPTEIQEMNEESIHLYQQALNEGKVNIYHIRAYVVGPQGVGKTILTQRLLNMDIDLGKRQSTNSIETYIRKCIITIPDGKWVVEEGMVEESFRVGRKIGDCIKNYLQSGRRQSSPIQTLTPTLPIYEMPREDKPEQPKHSKHNLINREKYDNENLSDFEDIRDYVNSESSDLVKKTAEVSIWDFGGQFIFNTTHQTYLTRRGVYMVVVAMNRNLEDYVDEEGFAFIDLHGEKRWKYKDYLIFWLHSIRTFAKDAPVIFVATHLDEFQGDVSEFFNDVKSQLIKEDQTLDWIQKCDVFAVDNTCRHTVIKDLQNAIFNTAKKQPHWGEEIPAKWVILQNAIGKRSNKLLTIKELTEIDLQTNSPINSQKEIQLFLRFFHELGNLIYFEELGNTIILDPKWLIDAFRCIVTSEQFSIGGFAKPFWNILTDTGKLTQDILTMVWEKNKEEDFNAHKSVLQNILSHLGIIATPTIYEGENSDRSCDLDYFFVPSMLKVRKQKVIETKYASPVLAYRLPKHLSPIIFNRVLSHTINKWPTVTGKDNEPHISCGIGYFNLGNKGSQKLALSLQADVIQLQLLSEDFNPKATDGIDVLEFVDNTLERILHGSFKQCGCVRELHYIECPKKLPGSGPELIPVSKLVKCPIYMCQNKSNELHVHLPGDLLRHWLADQEITQMEEKHANEAFGNQKSLQELLISAIGNDDESGIMHLLKCGANVNYIDENGQMPIHHAATTKNATVLQILIDIGASINSTTREGKTALHIASEHGEVKIVDVLLQNNSSVFLSDISGKTPIFYAVEFNHIDVMKSLIEVNSNLTNVDVEGKSLLYYAAAKENKQMIKCLAENEQNKHGIFEVCLRQLEIALKMSNKYLGQTVIESFLRNYFTVKQSKGLQSAIFSRAKESLQMVCISFEEQNPENLLKAWPAYQDQTRGPVFIIAFVTDIPESRVSSFFGLEVRYRLYDYVNEEARVILNSSHSTLIEKADYTEIKNTIDSHTNNLRLCHSNLTCISASTVKSVRVGKDLNRTLCIALCCRYKGMIPFGEEPFPTQIGTYPTDVREGYVMLKSSIPRNIIPSSTERHDILRIGCSISRKGCYSSGSLGGFVEHDNKLYFLTCAHVVFTPDECTIGQVVNITHLSQAPKVCQPGEGDAGADRYSEDRKHCGHVVKARFIPERNVSIDVALVEIADSRCPEANEVVGLQRAQLKDCGFDEVPDMSRISVVDIQDYPESDDVDRAVFKIGSRSGITRGLIRPDGTKAFTSTQELVEFSDRSKVYEIKNQIEIEPRDGCVFSIGGDSGSLVFMRKNMMNHCVGILHGRRSDGKVFVTPIKEVFKALDIPITSLRGYHDCSQNAGTSSAQ